MIVCQKAVVQTAQGESRKERCEKERVGGRHRVTQRGWRRLKSPRRRGERGEAADQREKILVGNRATWGEVHRTHSAHSDWKDERRLRVTGL